MLVSLVGCKGCVRHQFLMGEQCTASVALLAIAPTGAGFLAHAREAGRGGADSRIRRKQRHDFDCRIAAMLGTRWCSLGRATPQSAKVRPELVGVIGRPVSLPV